MKIQIFQIAYNEETLKLIDMNKAFLCFNRSSSPFLENDIIANLQQIADNRFEYFGILSARFEEKMKYKQSKAKKIDGIHSAIEEDGYSNDVYSFFGSSTKRNVWKQAEQWQPGILEVAELIFKQYSIERGQPVGNLLQLDTPVVYQNAFVAKKEIYFDYVQNWLRPLMSIMNTNEAIKSLLFKDAKYKDAKLSAEECLQVFGVPFYTFHSFVCERFFSTYLAVNKEISIKQI